MNLVKIITKIFTYLFVAIALLMVVSVLPIQGNIKSFVVLSGSMSPKIGTGSVVFVIPQKNYSVGDVITFGQVSKTQTPTTHRIVDSRVVNGEQWFITKGDANNANDGKEITKGDILGRVFLFIPLLGYVINFARNPVVFISIIVLCAAIIIVEQVKSIAKELKKEEKETKVEQTQENQEK